MRRNFYNRRILMFFFFIFIITTFCGCHMQEPESRDAVAEIYIDKLENYKCTLGIAEFSKESQDVTTEHIQAEGATIANCLESIDDHCSGRLYFAHTQLCVVSLRALEDEKTLKELIDMTERNKEMSRRILITAAKDIEKLVNDKEGIYRIADKYYSSRKNKTDIGDITKQLLETGNCTIPVIEKYNEGISFGDTAIIKEYKLCATAEDNVAKGLMWLQDKGKNESVLNIYVDGIPIVININEEKIKKTPYISKFVIDIKARGTVEQYSHGKEINKEKLKSETEKEFKKTVENAVAFIKQHKTDCIGIEETFRKYNYGVYKSNRGSDYFIDIPVEINTEINFEYTGIG